MKNILFISLLTIVLFSSCEKWEDYTTDYQYTAVYISHQNQLRTIVANDPMSFELGVFMGGRRANTSDEWVKYRVDPTLLTNTNFVGDKTFTLLPPEWYTLSSPDTFIIPEGSFLGTVTLTLNRELFAADPASLGVNYAIPIKIYETSVDTILQGKYSPEGSVITPPKDYAVIVIKYINPYHGNYYIKGTQYKLDAGEYVVDEVYDVKDLSRNRVVELKTGSLSESSTTYAGAKSTVDNIKLGLKFTVNTDNTVNIEAAEGATSITSLSNASGTYDPASRSFTIGYDFTTADGSFRVTEKLIWRNTDLVFEQW